MIKQMNYNGDFISLMTELAAINPTLIFRKNEDGDKITVKAIENADKSICYILDASKDAFAFESDSLAMIDFNRFISYFNTFNKANKDEKLSDTPILSVEYDDDATEARIMHINSSKQKCSFKHRLADEDAIVKPSFNRVKFPSLDATLKISDDQLANLVAMKKLTDADRIKWAFHDSVCTVTLYNTRTTDTYETDFVLDASVETTFEYSTLAKGLPMIPDGSYAVEVSKSGIMSFKQDRTDGIDLILYLAKTGK